MGRYEGTKLRRMAKITAILLVSSLLVGCSIDGIRPEVNDAQRMLLSNPPSTVDIDADDDSGTKLPANNSLTINPETGELEEASGISVGGSPNKSTRELSRDYIDTSEYMNNYLRPLVLQKITDNISGSPGEEDIYFEARYWGLTEEESAAKTRQASYSHTSPTLSSSDTHLGGVELQNFILGLCPQSAIDKANSEIRTYITNHTGEYKDTDTWLNAQNGQPTNELLQMWGYVASEIKRNPSLTFKDYCARARFDGVDSITGSMPNVNCTFVTKSGKLSKWYANPYSATTDGQSSYYKPYVRKDTVDMLRNLNPMYDNSADSSPNLKSNTAIVKMYVNQYEVLVVILACKSDTTLAKALGSRYSNVTSLLDTMLTPNQVDQITAAIKQSKGSTREPKTVSAGAALTTIG